MAGKAHAGQADRAAFGVVVVGQGVDGDRRALDRRRLVGPRLGRRVRHGHGHRHVRRADRAGAIAYGVGEAVDAVEARLRRVADRLVGLDRDRAVRRRVDADDGERIALGIIVVGQHGHIDTAADRHAGGVARRRRRRVRPRHDDGDLAVGGAAELIANGVGEAVGAGKPGCRGVGEALVRIEHQGAGRRQGVAANAEIAAFVVAEDGDHHGHVAQRARLVGLGDGHGRSPGSRNLLCYISRYSYIRSIEDFPPAQLASRCVPGDRIGATMETARGRRANMTPHSPDEA